MCVRYGKEGGREQKWKVGMEGRREKSREGGKE